MKKLALLCLISSMASAETRQELFYKGVKNIEACRVLNLPVSVVESNLGRFKTNIWIPPDVYDGELRKIEFYCYDLINGIAVEYVMGVSGYECYDYTLIQDESVCNPIKQIRAPTKKELRKTIIELNNQIIELESELTKLNDELKVATNDLNEYKNKYKYGEYLYKGLTNTLAARDRQLVELESKYYKTKSNLDNVENELSKTRDKLQSYVSENWETRISIFPTVGLRIGVNTNGSKYTSVWDIYPRFDWGITGIIGGVHIKSGIGVVAIAAAGFVAGSIQPQTSVDTNGLSQMYSLGPGIRFGRHGNHISIGVLPVVNINTYMIPNDQWYYMYKWGGSLIINSAIVINKMIIALQPAISIYKDSFDITMRFGIGFNL